MRKQTVMISIVSTLSLILVTWMSNVAWSSPSNLHLPIILNAVQQNPLPNLQGEVCWNYSDTNYSLLGTVKLRFNYIGGISYLCNGTIEVPSLNKSFPVFGNVEIVEEKVVMTLSAAGIGGGKMGIDMTKAILDPTSLNGKYGVLSINKSICK